MVDIPALSTEQDSDPHTGRPLARPSLGTRPRAGLVGGTVGLLWRFFSSVRAAIWEIAFLAVLTLIGTLRGSGVPRSLADRAPVFGNLVDAWYGWDTFGSWLYSATLAVIAIAIIVGGMLNRIPGMWKTIVQPTVTTTLGFLQGTAPHATMEMPVTSVALASALRSALRRQRYRVLVAPRGEDVHIYADRNRWGKLGTFPFHIALVMVVVGGIVATQFGFRDKAFVVPEGGTVPIGQGSDLSIRLNSFNDDYYQDGTASLYQSDISLLRGNEVVQRGLVEPNDPIREGGLSVYQAGFGYNVSLRVTDRGGNELFRGPVTLGEFKSTANPDAPAGVLRVPGTNTTLNLIASDRNRANRPDLDILQLPAEALYVQARSDDLLPGSAPPAAIIDLRSPAQLGDLNVQFERYGVFSALQVAYYPGLWLFGVAGFIGVVGLIAIFYFPLRRVRAIVTTGPDGGAVAVVAPLARRDWSGKRDFMGLIETLRQVQGASIQINDAPDRPARWATNQRSTG